MERLPASFELGERVIFRSLLWEVADVSSAACVELFGLGSCCGRKRSAGTKSARWRRCAAMRWR